MFLILLTNVIFVYTSYSQTLIQQIENAYSALDSVSYIENIILSFGKEIGKQQKEMENTTLELSGFNYISIDSIQRQNILDSINNIRRKSIHFQEIKTWSIEERINEFSDKIRAKTPIYALNLIPQEDRTLQVDTSKLSFNLFYLDEYFNLEFYVLVNKEKYVDSNNMWFIFSRQVERNFPKILKKIMRKNPKYLLFSVELAGANSFLYVLNDKIYVCQIAQMEEYELNDYIKKFGTLK